MNIRYSEYFPSNQDPDFLERPHVIVLAHLPIDVEEMRAKLREIREEQFAGKEVTFEIMIRNLNTGETFNLDSKGPLVPIEEIDFSEFV